MYYTIAEKSLEREAVFLFNHPFYMFPEIPHILQSKFNPERSVMYHVIFQTKSFRNNETFHVDMLLHLVGLN